MRTLRQRPIPGSPATAAFLLGVCLLLATLDAGPQAGRKDRNKQRNQQGSVSVFVVAAGTAPQAESIRLLAIAAVDDAGVETPLELALDVLDTAGLAGGKHPLASGRLPPGRYRGLRLTPAAGGNAENSDTPEPDASPAVSFEIPAGFRVARSETVTLTVQFDRAGGEPGTLAQRFRIRQAPDAVVRRLTLYVTNEAEDSVVAINRDDDEVFAVIPVGDRPRGIDVSAEGRRVFVANAGDDTVSVLDPSTHRVVDTITLKSGCRPEDLAVGLDGRRLVVSCPGLSLLTVLDPLTNAVLGEFALARRPGRIAVGRDQRTIYALVPEGNQIVSADLLRPGSRVRTAGIDAQPTDLAVDGLSGMVFVTHARAPVVSSFDAQLESARQLQLGAFSYGLVAEADGRRLYASGGDAGGLALIGPQVGTVIRRWNTPPGYNLALDPDGRKVYLAGGASGTLIVVDRIAGRMVRKVQIGKSATDLVVIP